MAAPFAAIEARANAAVMRRLANAEVIVNEVALSAIYARETVVINGIEGTHPTLQLTSSDVAAQQIAEGTQLRIPGADQHSSVGVPTFTVRGLQPDGSGLTTLILETC